MKSPQRNGKYLCVCESMCLCGISGDLQQGEHSTTHTHTHIIHTLYIYHTLVELNSHLSKVKTPYAISKKNFQHRIISEQNEMTNITAKTR